MFRIARSFKFYAIVLCVLASSFQVHAIWQPIGPYGGTINSLLIKDTISFCATDIRCFRTLGTAFR